MSKFLEGLSLRDTSQATSKQSQRLLRFARNDVKRMFAFLIFCLLLLTSPVFAQDAAAPIPDDSSGERTIGSATLKTTDKLYLDFKRATLLNVLTILSELSQINFVAGREVADYQVNMVLDDVTFEDALEAIAQGSNVVYEYLPDRNVYLFRRAADNADTPLLMTKVFKLYYVRATAIREIEGESSGGGGSGGGGGTTSGSTFTVLKEATAEGAEEDSSIYKIVESILSERGHVQVDDRSNSLVVTDVEDRLRLVEQAIAQLDRRLDQVLINTFLIETFEDLDRFLGIEWAGDNTTAGQEGTLGLISGGSKETRFPFNANDYNVLTRVFGKTSLSTNGIAKDTDVTTEGLKDFTDLTVRFRALQDADKLKIIAKPRILVLDNHPALIKITTNEAIGSQTTTAGAEGIAASSTTAERTETGTSLRVTPLINMDNRITMTVEPRFVTSAASATVASTRDPTIRTARTTLMLNDGQTLVMGGLLDSRAINNERKTPFLGDIPWIGEIFTRRVTDTDDRELMLFITPQIIRDPGDVQARSIPDQRDRFDDLKAPFWQANKKNWYKKLKAEAAAEQKQEVDIAARQKLIEDTLVELSHKQKQPSVAISAESETSSS